MLYRRFGKTELQMPVLSLGLMRSMHSWQDQPLSKIPGDSSDTLRLLVTRALELGINHFETARGYGSSERQLGGIITEIPRHKLIIQTKIPPYPNPKNFINDFDDSLARMQLDYVDLLAIHGINDYQTLWYSCHGESCLAAARELQAQGKVGSIGFSSHGSPEILQKAINCKDHGGFDYVNLHWYFINQVNHVAISQALENDMGVYVISPTDKGGMLYSPSEKMRELCKPLSPMLFNDLYCLMKKGISSISVGASCLDDFSEHIKAISLLESSENLGVEKIERRLLQAMEQKTGYARPDALWSMLPEWEKSPGYINIPMILWLYNLAIGWGMNDFAKRRYRQLGNDMPWVPGNNAALVRQYDFSEVLKESPVQPNHLVGQLEAAHKMLGRRV